MHKAILRTVLRGETQSWDDFWIATPIGAPVVINMTIRIGTDVSIKVVDRYCVGSTVRGILMFAFGVFMGAEKGFSYHVPNLCQIKEPDIDIYGISDRMFLRIKIRELEEKYGKTAKITESFMRMPRAIFPFEEEKEHVRWTREERARALEEDDAGS